MSTKPTKPNIGPVTIAVPNTSEAKLYAINELCQAVHTLAKTLASVNVAVTVSNCNISGVETGIDMRVGGGK